MNSNNLKKYQTKNPIARKLINNYLKTLNFLIKPYTNLKILEVGCGEGFIVNYLIKNNNYIDITGTDLNKNSLEIAKTLNPNIKFFQSDIYKLPLKNNSYDLILCPEVLEHLDNPTQALSELKRVTKKYCLITIPNEPLFTIINLLRGKNITRFGKDKDHLQFWNTKKITNIVANHFKILKIKKIFPWIMLFCEKKTI